MNLWHKKMVSIGLICLLVGLMLGFCAGSYFTIKAVVSIGSSFLDKELVEQAIYMYKDNIKNCFPMVDLRT